MFITEAKLGKLDVYVAILANNTQESSILTALNEAESACARVIYSSTILEFEAIQVTKYKSQLFRNRSSA